MNDISNHQIALEKAVEARRLRRVGRNALERLRLLVTSHRDDPALADRMLVAIQAETELFK